MNQLYSVTCDDALKYVVVANSEDECKSLIRGYEGFDHPDYARFAIGFSKWEFVHLGPTIAPAAMVLSFEVLVNEPTTKGDP